MYDPSKRLEFWLGESGCVSYRYALGTESFNVDGGGIRDIGKEVTWCLFC
jgi:hypothetical protein